MTLRRSFLWVFLLGLSVSAMAFAKGTVKGVVTDAAGNPASGVKVRFTMPDAGGSTPGKGGGSDVPKLTTLSMINLDSFGAQPLQGKIGRTLGVATTDDKGKYEIQVEAGEVRYAAGVPTTIGYKVGMVSVKDNETVQCDIQLSKPVRKQP